MVYPNLWTSSAEICILLIWAVSPAGLSSGDGSGVGWGRLGSERILIVPLPGLGSQGLDAKARRSVTSHRSDQGLRKISLHLVIPSTVYMIASSDESLIPKKYPLSTLAAKLEVLLSSRKGLHQICSAKGTTIRLEGLPLIAS